MNAAVKCSTPGCQVAKDGRCLEGLATDKCPHYGKEGAPASAAEAEVPSDAADQARTEVRPERQLSTADLITADQAGIMCCSAASKSIAFVGPSNAGKSSLIASL